MSAAQAIASSRFLTAMGPMIEDEQKMNEVLEYIESIKMQSLRKQLRWKNLTKEGCHYTKLWINYVKRHANTIRHESVYR